MIRKLTYNNRALTAEERVEYCRQADKYINMYSGYVETAFQLAKDAAKVSGNLDFTEINKVMFEISTFTTYAFCDCIVLDKLFVRATNPYEKSFLRGKWKVHLNESFKRLYGFNKNGYKNSYCAKLEQLVNRFFPGFKEEFRKLMSDFEQLSKDSWWKDERNAEVHIDVAKLYELRHEEINESKIAMEANLLTSLIHRLDLFTRDLYGVYFRYMKTQYIKEHGHLPDLNG